MLYTNKNKKFIYMTIIFISLLLFLADAVTLLILFYKNQQNYNASGVTFGLESRKQVVDKYYKTGMFGPNDKFYWYKQAADAYSIPTYIIIGHHIIEETESFSKDWVTIAKNNRGDISEISTISNVGALGPYQFLAKYWNKVVQPYCIDYWLKDVINVRNPSLYEKSKYWSLLTDASKLDKYSLGVDADKDGITNPFSIYDSLMAMGKYDSQHFKDIENSKWKTVLLTQLEKEIGAAALHFNGSFANSRADIPYKIKEYIQIFKQQNNLKTDEEMLNFYSEKSKNIPTEDGMLNFISKEKQALTKDIANKVDSREGVAYGFKVVLMGKAMEDFWLRNALKDIDNSLSLTASTIGGKMVQLAVSFLGCAYAWGANGQIAKDYVYANGGEQIKAANASEDQIKSTKAYLENHSKYKNMPCFDCSGFISYVYRKVTGDSLRYNTHGFYMAGLNNAGRFRAVKIAPDYSNLQPGDMILYGKVTNGIVSTTHIVLYIGDGKVVEAPESGRGVEINFLRKKTRNMLPYAVRVVD